VKGLFVGPFMLETRKTPVLSKDYSLPNVRGHHFAIFTLLLHSFLLNALTSPCSNHSAVSEPICQGHYQK